MTITALSITNRFTILVRGRGFEPPSPCERYHLKVVRLPISPPAQDITKILNYLKKFVQCCFHENSKEKIKSLDPHLREDDRKKLFSHKIKIFSLQYEFYLASTADVF